MKDTTSVVLEDCTAEDLRDIAARLDGGEGPGTPPPASRSSADHVLGLAKAENIRLSIEYLPGKGKGYFVNPAEPWVPATTDGLPVQKPQRNNIPHGLSLDVACDAFLARNDLS
jgi:hypothetical protein